ncbi:MAG: hypothetical protein AB7F88_03665 [Pyrinomonadaceae bacterium]
MKHLIFAFLIFAFAACGGSGNNKQQVAIPPGADLKADILIQRTDGARSIEVTFYISTPTAPGVKDAPPIEPVELQEVRFNDTDLTKSTNEAGRTIYTGQNLPLRAENAISGKLNGQVYEARAIPQTTLPSKSVTSIMAPK